MSEKFEFTGDVGQAVMGDVQEAPRLSNVVTLNMGKEALPPAPAITDFQRSRISQLVKDLASLTGDHTLDIYRIIFTEFGIEKIRELPRDRYKETVALVEKWIADAKDAAQPKAEQPAPQAVVEKHAHAGDPCARCEEKDLNFARQRRTNLAQCALIVILAGSCGWLLYKMPDSSDSGSHHEDKCYFDGKAYSLGSTVRHVSGAPQECEIDAAGDSAKWAAVRRLR